MSSHQTPADPLGQLADEFVEQCQQGECPSVEEYAARFPEHAARIRELFPMLAMMEDAVRGHASEQAEGSTRREPPSLDRVDDYRLLREIGRGGMGIVYEAEQVSLRRRVAVKLLSPHIAENEQLMSRFQREAQAAARLHHPNIVPVFDVGQDGTVSYYAMQLIRGQGLDSVIRELKSLGIGADLHVKIRAVRETRENSEGGGSGTEVGSTSAKGERIARSLLSGQYARDGWTKSDPRPELAETVVSPSNEEFSQSGRSSQDSSIAQRESATAASPTSVVLSGDSGTSCAAGGAIQYFRSVARLGVQVADALAHAHREGIIHRDIKPSNLVLDMQGQVWVTDFGLAKTEDGDLTQSGDVLGTLQYMPPERFRGWSDPRSDLYSLGITLYEMLALRPAFDGADRMRVMHQILEEAPVPLTKLDSRIPADLEAIVLKATHREPQYRYQSGADLKEDLERFLKGEPIVARRVTRGEQFWLWCRRNPVIAALLSALLFVLIAGLAAVTSQWRRAEANAVVARKNASRAETAARKAEREAQRATTAARREREARETAETARRRMRRLLYVARMNSLFQAWQEANVARIHELLSIYMPNGSERDLRGFEWYYWWKKSHPYHASFSHGAPVLGTAMTNNGDVVVSAGGGRVPIKLWDAESGRLIRELEGAEGWIYSMAVSASGRWLAAGESDGEVRLWDLESGENNLLPHPFENEVRAVTFDPTGTKLAAGSRDGEVRLWNIPDRRLDSTWSALPDAVSALDWSPDGESLAVAFGDWSSERDNRQIWIRNVEGNDIRHLPAARGPLTLDLAYSNDGRMLAAAGTNDVMLWSLPSGRFQQLRQHSDVVEAVAFSPEDRWLASGGSDRLIQLWETQTQSHFATLKGHGDAVSSLTFSANGNRLVSGSHDGSVKIWADFSSKSSEDAIQHDDSLHSVCVSPDGTLAAAGGDGGTVFVHNLKTGALETTLRGELQTITEVYFLPNRPWLIACGSRENTQQDGPGPIEIWSLERNERLRSFGHSEAACLDASVSPDGRYLATGGRDGTVRIHSVTDGSLIDAFNEHSVPVHAVAFSRDGTLLASAGTDRMIRIRNRKTGERVASFPGHTATILDLEFSPDDRWLASAGEDHTVRLWNVAKGTLHAVLRGHAKRVKTVAFSPSGRTLATGSGDQTIRLWDPISGRQKGRLDGHSLRVDCLDFSPDGRTLVSADISGLLRFWRAETGSVPPEQ